jgi:hypothetical protein
MIERKTLNIKVEPALRFFPLQTLKCSLVSRFPRHYFQALQGDIEDMRIGVRQWASRYPVALLPLTGIIPKRTIGSGMTATRSGRALVSLLISLLLLTGCSGGQDKKAAIEAINKGMRKEALSVHVLLGRVSPKCAPIVHARGNQDLTTVTDYQAAEKGGLISMTPDGPGFWKVELVNPKPGLVEALKNSHRYGKDGCDYVLFNFSVAEKSVADINLHEISSEKAEAEFTWKWVLTPLGVRLVDSLNAQQRAQVNADLETSRLQSDPTFDLSDITQSSSPHPGKKSLKKSADGWVLDE